MKNCFLFEQLFVCYAYSVVFEDDNIIEKNNYNNVTKVYDKTIVARCNGGSMGFVKTLGANAIRCFTSGAIITHP